MWQFNEYLQSQINAHAEKQNQIIKKCLPSWITQISEKYPTFAKYLFKYVLNRAIKTTWRQGGNLMKGELFWGIVEVTYFGKTVFIDPLYAEQKKEIANKWSKVTPYTLY